MQNQHINCTNFSTIAAKLCSGLQKHALHLLAVVGVFALLFAGTSMIRTTHLQAAAPESPVVTSVIIDGVSVPVTQVTIDGVVQNVPYSSSEPSNPKVSPAPVTIDGTTTPVQMTITKPSGSARPTSSPTSSPKPSGTPYTITPSMIGVTQKSEVNAGVTSSNKLSVLEPITKADFEKVLNIDNGMMLAAGAGTCTDGYFRCVNGYEQQCQNGTYISIKAICTLPQPSVSEGPCDVELAGQCKDDTYYYCGNSGPSATTGKPILKWYKAKNHSDAAKDPMLCKTDEYYAASSGADEGSDKGGANVCNQGYVRCVNGLEEICWNNQWKSWKGEDGSQGQCPTRPAASETSCAIQHGGQCKDNVLYNCSSSTKQWKKISEAGAGYNMIKCNTDEYYALTGVGKNVCTDGTVRCVSGKEEKCSDGQFVPMTLKKNGAQTICENPRPEIDQFPCSPVSAGMCKDGKYYVCESSGKNKNRWIVYNDNYSNTKYSCSEPDYYALSGTNTVVPALTCSGPTITRLNGGSTGDANATVKTFTPGNVVGLSCTGASLFRYQVILDGKTVSQSDGATATYAVPNVPGNYQVNCIPLQ